MKKEFKVQAISEKIDTLEVHGQKTSYNCLHNCRRIFWFGHKSSKTKGCHQEPIYDAYQSINL